MSGWSGTGISGKAFPDKSKINYFGSSKKIYYFGSKLIILVHYDTGWTILCNNEDDLFRILLYYYVPEIFLLQTKILQQYQYTWNKESQFVSP